jgi:hypothetical protein
LVAAINPQFADGSLALDTAEHTGGGPVASRNPASDERDHELDRIEPKLGSALYNVRLLRKRLDFVDDLCW